MNGRRICNDAQTRLRGQRCPSRGAAWSPVDYGEREKAVGIYAAGLLLQLPVPGARFRCNSMQQSSRKHI
jgi:hypothetical protein